MSRYNEVGAHKTRVYGDEKGAVCVKYHSTIVFKLNNDGTVELNTGGWKTNTTKLRINQASQHFLAGRIDVYQEKHQWYVVDKAAAVVEPVKWDGERITLPAAKWPQ